MIAMLWHWIQYVLRLVHPLWSLKKVNHEDWHHMWTSSSTRHRIVQQQQHYMLLGSTSSLTSSSASALILIVDLTVEPTSLPFSCWSLSLSTSRLPKLKQLNWNWATTELLKLVFWNLNIALLCTSLDHDNHYQQPNPVTVTPPATK